MVVYGCIWLYMPVYGCIWLYMAVYGCIWLYMAVYGCIWLCMAVCGCIWLYMAANGCIWLYMAASNTVGGLQLSATQYRKNCQLGGRQLTVFHGLICTVYGYIWLYMAAYGRVEQLKQNLALSVPPLRLGLTRQWAGGPANYSPWHSIWAPRM